MDHHRFLHLMISNVIDFLYLTALSKICTDLNLFTCLSYKNCMKLMKHMVVMTSSKVFLEGGISSYCTSVTSKTNLARQLLCLRYVYIYIYIYIYEFPWCSWHSYQYLSTAESPSLTLLIFAHYKPRTVALPTTNRLKVSQKCLKVSNGILHCLKIYHER